MHPDAEQRFRSQLLRYSQEADAGRRASLEREIWDEFGSERAVLVLDMSGFSLLSNRYGILHYLSMVHRMQRTAEPIIQGLNGQLLKFEADNAFAVFPAVRDAVRAAVALNFAFEAANRLTPESLDIHIACGIDAGPILVIGAHEFFGEAVNVASKLGEDLAEAGEILISQGALARAGEVEALRPTARNFEASGLQIDAFALHWQGIGDEFV